MYVKTMVLLCVYEFVNIFILRFLFYFIIFSIWLWPILLSYTHVIIINFYPFNYIHVILMYLLFLIIRNLQLEYFLIKFLSL